MRAATLILCLCASLAWTSIGPPIAQAAPLCPRIYKPVCGVVPASDIATYANSCDADKAGATILHVGKCQGPGQARCPHNPFKPVCAKTIMTQVEKTYDNLCWAEKDWAVWLHDGPC
jgi:hypothetical protein